MFYLVSFFDEESNSVSDHPFLIPIHFLTALQTGSLTAQLSDNPQKVNGLAGITLGTIIQSFACLIAGSVLGLAFIWRVALVGMGTLTAVFEIFILHELIIVNQRVFRSSYQRVTSGWYVSALITFYLTFTLLYTVACRGFERSSQQKGPCRVRPVGL